MNKIRDYRQSGRFNDFIMIIIMIIISRFVRNCPRVSSLVSRDLSPTSSTALGGGGRWGRTHRVSRLIRFNSFNCINHARAENTSSIFSAPQPVGPRAFLSARSFARQRRWGDQEQRLLQRIDTTSTDAGGFLACYERDLIP